MTDARDSIDDDDLPILPDSDYEERRRALGIDAAAAPVELQDPGANEEQLLYASILAKGMYLGLGLLLISFFIYIAGLLPAGVPIEELPNYWTLSAHEYLEAVNHDFLHREELILGWGWLSVLSYGDYLNFLGIALLSAVTIVCYAGILPILFRKRDWIYATIAILEIVVLVLAASGQVAAGH